MSPIKQIVSPFCKLGLGEFLPFIAQLYIQTKQPQFNPTGVFITSHTLQTQKPELSNKNIRLSYISTNIVVNSGSKQNYPVFSDADHTDL